ncbi:MAG: hypothetical protein ACRED3_15570 [Bradyrhizobium sp.]
MSSAPLIIRNAIAIFGWVFMSLWLAMLCLFTWLFIREGGFHQFPLIVEIGIMAMFWLFGWAGGAHSFNVPVTVLKTDGRGVVISERRVWKREHVWIARDAISTIDVSAGKDSDGDAYYKLLLAEVSGRQFVLAESSDRARVEAVRDKLQASLAGMRG